ncbi:MAG: DoxX family protein [Pseudomonadota bacterium]
MTSNAIIKGLSTIGRIGIASLFALGALNKILNFAATAESMDTANLPFVPVLLPLTILFEFAGAMALIFGRLSAAVASLAMAAYVLLVNVIFHPFWTMDGVMRDFELSLFFKNISIAGALIFLAASRLEKAGETSA